MKRKKTFTTGQVAKVCDVAPRTVSKWFDAGEIRGYRIPGSKDRRIPREQVIKFLKEHGIPFGDLENEGWHKILIIGAEQFLISRVQELLPEDEDFKYELANTGFEAGIRAADFHPDTIIIDMAMGRTEGLHIAMSVRRHPDFRKAILLAMASKDEADTEFLELHFNAVFKKPFDVALLAEAVRTLTGVTNGQPA